MQIAKGNYMKYLVELQSKKGDNNNDVIDDWIAAIEENRDV